MFNTGERFALFLPLSLVLSLFVIAHRRSEKGVSQIGLKTLLLVTPLLGILAITRLDSSHPPSIDPPFEEYARITQSIENFSIPMLIAHQGLNFYYKFKTTREAFSYEPERHWDKNRIWRLIYGLTAEEISHHSPPHCSWANELIRKVNAKNYTLMREDCYYRMRIHISQEKDPALYETVWDQRYNPSQHRPAFLYKKHERDDPDEFPALDPKKKT